VFHLNDLHHFSPIKVVDGQKNRRIIPPFADSATHNSPIGINKRLNNSIDDEKAELLHKPLANVCLRC
jgi:hypothetical protein